MIQAALQGLDACRDSAADRLYRATIPSAERVHEVQLGAIAKIRAALTSAIDTNLLKLHSFFADYFNTRDRTAEAFEKWALEMGDAKAWGDALLLRGVASLLNAHFMILNGDDRWADMAHVMPLEEEQDSCQPQFFIPLAHVEMPVISDSMYICFSFVVFKQHHSIDRRSGITRLADALRGHHRTQTTRSVIDCYFSFETPSKNNVFFLILTFQT